MARLLISISRRAFFLSALYSFYFLFDEIALFLAMTHLNDRVASLEKDFQLLARTRGLIRDLFMHYYHLMHSVLNVAFFG